MDQIDDIQTMRRRGRSAYVVFGVVIVAALALGIQHLQKQLEDIREQTHRMRQEQLVLDTKAADLAIEFQRLEEARFALTEAQAAAEIQATGGISSYLLKMREMEKELSGWEQEKEDLSNQLAILKDENSILTKRERKLLEDYETLKERHSRCD